MNIYLYEYILKFLKYRIIERLFKNENKEKYNIDKEYILESKYGNYKIIDRVGLYYKTSNLLIIKYKEIGKEEIRYIINKYKIERIIYDVNIKKIYAGYYMVNINLKEVILPESLKEIDDLVFTGCSNLRKINLPDRIERIGNYCFQNCYKLDNIKLPKNLKILEAFVFSNCYNLKNFKINNGIEKVHPYSFESICFGGDNYYNRIMNQIERKTVKYR